MPDTDDESIIIQQIYNEEDLSERLDVIASSVLLPWKIVWNYWRGLNSGDYLSLQTIIQEINSLSLTKEGKIRLQAKVKPLIEKAQPTFSRMAIQLWPLGALAVVKSIIIPALSRKAKIAYRTARLTKLRGGTKSENSHSPSP